MSTEIRLIEGESIRVGEEYREVYERLAAAGWQNPVEFKQHHGDGENPITVNRPTSSTCGRDRPSTLAYTRSTASRTPAMCAQCAQQ
jgi:hypothetical protein